MKIKVAELEGAKLDFFVAKAEGREVYLHGGNCFLRGGQRDWHANPMGYYSPSTEWSQGGPIIEREGITICPAHPKGWSATIDDERWEDDCATPLIAAMRCFVASKFGEEVEE